MEDRWVKCPGCGYNIATLSEILSERHWQAFLAALTGMSSAIALNRDSVFPSTLGIVSDALCIADEAVRQYRGPEEKGNG